MATAYALETQLRDNGFAGTAEIYNNDGSGLVTCDDCSSHQSYSCYANDVYWYDSCGVREGKKEECGAPGCTGNTCGVGTSPGSISGAVSGDAQEDVLILLFENSCSSSSLLDYVYTAADGRYGFAGLLAGSYNVQPQEAGFTFSPSESDVRLSNDDMSEVANFTCYGSCISHDSSTCYANDVYWYDSCGVREEKRQECGAPGCTGNTCDSSCSSHDSSTCYANDVYWYDSCGVREDKRQECGAPGCTGNTCDDCSEFTTKSSCNDQEPECTWDNRNKLCVNQ
jgi:uncharacterized protein YcfL